jgi:hypothetical protein
VFLGSIDRFGLMGNAYNSWPTQKGHMFGVSNVQYKIFVFFFIVLVSGKRFGKGRMGRSGVLDDMNLPGLEFNQPNVKPSSLEIATVQI